MGKTKNIGSYDRFYWGIAASGLTGGQRGSRYLPLLSNLTPARGSLLSLLCPTDFFCSLFSSLS